MSQIPPIIRGINIWLGWLWIGYISASLGATLGMWAYVMIVENQAFSELFDLNLLVYPLVISTWLLPAIGAYQLVRLTLKSFKLLASILYFSLALPLVALMSRSALRHGEEAMWGEFILYLYCPALATAYLALTGLNRLTSLTTYSSLRTSNT